MSPRESFHTTVANICREDTPRTDIYIYIRVHDAYVRGILGPEIFRGQIVPVYILIKGVRRVTKWGGGTMKFRKKKRDNCCRVRVPYIIVIKE